MALEVDLVAAQGKVWSGQARMVSANAGDGEIGILSGHEPILTVLRPGEVRITPPSGDVMRWHVDGGFMSVDGDRVTVVVDSARSSAGGAAGTSAAADRSASH